MRASRVLLLLGLDGQAAVSIVAAFAAVAAARSA
jgi:hypothetical protein